MSPTWPASRLSTHRRGNAAFSEADSPFMAAEPRSSPRGRPPVFSEESLRQAAGYSYARRIATRRGAQDLVYRMFAVAVLEHYCEAYPEKAETLGWLLWPKRRHTLLTELGRVVGQVGRVRPGFVALPAVVAEQAAATPGRLVVSSHRPSVATGSSRFVP